MHIVLLDTNNEVVKNDQGTPIIFYNVVKPHDLFERSLKHVYSDAIAWKEYLVSYEDDKILVDIRQRRNRLLSFCDWTQIADNGLTQEKREEWRLYRKALRDLTEDFAGELVKWPTAPDGSM